MENVIWNTPAFVWDADLTAEINNHTVKLYIEFFEGVKASIVVDDKFTTDKTEDWSEIEKVFPRLYWPEPIFRGQKYDRKPRLAPKALVEAIEKAQAEYEAE